jgi:hypothetical protein
VQEMDKIDSTTAVKSKKIFKAKIIKTFAGGVIIQISKDNSDGDGFLYPDDFYSKLLNDGDFIKVQYKKEAIGENRLATYKEYYDVEPQSRVSFSFVEDFDRGFYSGRKVVDKRGRVVTYFRQSWQTGSLYKPPSAESKITVEIGFDNQGMQTFKEIDRINPYFIEYKNLPFDDNEIKKIKSLVKINTQDKKLAMDLSKQYSEINSNWLLSLAKLIESCAKESLNRNDYRSAEKLFSQSIILIEFIRHQPFLALHRGAQRENVISSLKRMHNQSQYQEKWCSFISSDNKTDKVKKLLRQIFRGDPHKQLQESNHEIEIITRIIEEQTELLNNLQVEKLIDHLFQEEDFYKNPISHVLTIRRKSIRSKLFGKTLFGNTEKLIDDPLLKHLVSLENFQVKKGIYFNDIPGAQLDKASAKLYMSYLTADPIQMKVYADDCISILNHQLNFKTYGYDKEKRMQWSHQLNAILGGCYEYQAYRSTDEIETIQLLEEAMEYFRKGRNSRFYFIRELLNFYALRNAIVSDPIEQILDKSIAFYASLESSKDYWEFRTPIFKSLMDIYHIVNCYNDFSQGAFTFLHIRSTEQSQYELPIPDRKDLASIILANNLINDLSKEDEEVDFESVFRSFFLRGSLGINEFLGQQHSEVKEQSTFLVLLGEESVALEVKGSVDIDINHTLFMRRDRDKTKMWPIFLKTIAGFLNASGGTLIVGALEKKRCSSKEINLLKQEHSADEYDGYILCGVDYELKKIKKDVDAHFLWISEKLQKDLTHDITSFVKFDTAKHNGKTFYIFTVKPFHVAEGIWVKSKDVNKGEETFFARDNNRTIKKTPLEAAQYLANKNQNVALS